MKILIACRMNDHVADDMIIPILNSNIVTSIDVVRYKPLSYSHNKLNMHLHNLGKSKLSTYINFYKKTKSVLRKNKYDVLISFNPLPYGMLAAWANKKNVPMIMSLIGEDYNWYASKKVKGFFIRKHLRRCVAITIFGEYAKQGLINYGISTPIKILPHGIDLNLIKNQSVNIAERNIDVLSICYLQKRKRINVLIRSIAIIIDKFPNINVKIIGKGPQKGKLVKLILELGLSDNVELCGYVDNVNEYYKKSKLFISLGTMEGVPFAIIKAVANGLPVIASDVGATDSIVSHEKNGVLLREVNAIVVAQEISSLLRNEKLLKSYSKYSLSKKEELSFNASTNVWDEVLSEVL